MKLFFKFNATLAVIFILGSAFSPVFGQIEFEQILPSPPAPQITPPFGGVAFSSVNFADVDGDGDQDVLITGAPSQAVLYINDGTGNYTEATGTPFEPVRRSSAAFSDIDGDNDEDVLITGSSSSGPTAKLYRNDGSGNFNEVTGTPFTGVDSSAVAFADVDQDNDEDVFITGSSESGSTAKLYTNNGSGTFTEVTGTPFTGVSASSIAFSDIDGDNDQDVLITGQVNWELQAELYTNNGSGIFTKLTGTPFIPVSFGSVAFSDIDNDQDKDVLITGYTHNGEISVLYSNDGTGSFTETEGANIDSVENSSVAFSDIDDDNDQDLLVTGYGSDGPTARFYTNDGSGNFTKESRSSFKGVHHSAIAFSDVDGDNDQDVLVTGRTNTERLSLMYINKGNGQFAEATGTSFTGVSECSVECADIDGDNDQDVLIAGRDNTGANIIKLYKNNGGGNFSEVNDNPFPGVQFASTAFADIDNDSDQDVIVAGLEAGSPVSKLYFNDGTGTFTEATGPFSLPGVYYGSVDFGDVDGDNDKDLLLTGYSQTELIGSVYINNGQGAFTEASLDRIQEVMYSDGFFADVDGDNDQDILIAGENNAGGRVAKIYFNDGNGRFIEGTGNSLHGVKYASVAFADIDGDNDQDLTITGYVSSSEYITKLFINNGSGEFAEKANTPFQGVYRGSVDFADVDGDKDADLLLTGSSDQGYISKFYSNSGSGEFTEITGLPFEGVFSSSTVFADLDRDNDPDVIIAGKSSRFNQITIAYRNITSEIIWDGSNWSASPEPDKNAIIRGNLDLTSDLEVKSFIIDQDNQVTISDEHTLTINENLIINGGLMVESNGSLLMDTSSDQIGTATLQKQGWDTARYNLIGSPMKSESTSILGNQVYSYDETEPSGEARWLEPSGDMLPGAGYASLNTGQVIFNGIFNNGKLNVNISRTETDTNRLEGWNLISNPYPSAISVDSFIQNNSHLNNNIYFWDESGKSGYANSEDDFIVYDPETDLMINKGDLSSFEGFITSCQGFFVQKTTNGTGSLQFSNSMRVNGNSSNLLRVAATSIPYLTLQVVSQDGEFNELLVKFTEDAVTDIDKYDAYHLKGNPNLAFYSKVEAEDLIINDLPAVFPTDIQLGVDAEFSSTYTFSLSKTANLSDKYIYLEDLSTDSLINLKKTDYTVPLSSALDLQRFILRVSDQEVLSVNARKPLKIQIYTTGKKLFINDYNTRLKKVTVFDLTGRKIFRYSYSKAGKKERKLPVEPGIYLIRVNTGSDIVTKKVQVN